MRLRIQSAVLVFVLAPLLVATSAADLARVKAPEGASVYLISPADGETVRGPVTVRMGLRGMGVAPAGIDHPGTGHHHLLVNMPLRQVDLNTSLPFSDQTRHFGGGQTEATLELPKGTHTLQLLFMDFRHVSFDPPLVSDLVTIVVE